MSRRHALGGAVAAGAALLASSCSSEGEASADSAEGELTRVTFALSYLPDVSLDGMAAAVHEGYFAEEGLEVEVLPWGSSTPESLVAAGQADFGFATDTRTALLAMASGMALTSLFAVYQHTPYVLTTLAEREYVSPAELSGKTYGGFGSPMEIEVVNDMVEQAGGVGGAEAVTLSVAAYEALSSGRVDSVLSFPGDNFALQRKGVEVDTFDTTEFGVPDEYASLVIAGPSVLPERADLARRFVRALQRGYQFALSDPDKALEHVLADYPGDIEPEQAAFVSDLQTNRLYPSADGVVGSQDVAVWQANADWLIERGILADGSGTALREFDVTSHVSTEYLDAAVSS